MKFGKSFFFDFVPYITVLLCISFLMYGRKCSHVQSPQASFLLMSYYQNNKLRVVYKFSPIYIWSSGLVA